MKHKLEDGRYLMAAYDDIKSFFEENSLIGKNILDIVPYEHDYMIRNLADIENVCDLECSAAIHTDGKICIVFDDFDTLEIEFSGDGPVILGFNTADLKAYPPTNGNCYTLGTLFGYSMGSMIEEVIFEKSEHKMMFPSYRGIDMSEYDDGVCEIKFKMDDGGFLIAKGCIDYFEFESIDENGEERTVPYMSLFGELNDNTLYKVFEGELPADIINMKIDKILARENELVKILEKLDFSEECIEDGLKWLDEAQCNILKEYVKFKGEYLTEQNFEDYSLRIRRGSSMHYLKGEQDWGRLTQSEAVKAVMQAIEFADLIPISKALTESSILISKDKGLTIEGKTNILQYIMHIADEMLKWEVFADCYYLAEADEETENSFCIEYSNSNRSRCRVLTENDRIKRIEIEDVK